MSIDSFFDLSKQQWELVAIFDDAFPLAVVMNGPIYFTDGNIYANKAWVF